MEHRVFGLFVAAKVGADASQQHGETEGLGDIVIGPRLQAVDGVVVAGRRRQHDDGGSHLRLAHASAHLAPVNIGQVHVQQDQIGAIVDRRLHARLAG